MQSGFYLVIILFVLGIAAGVIYYLTRIRMRRRLEELRRREEELPHAALELRNTKHWRPEEAPNAAFKKIQLVLKNMGSEQMRVDQMAKTVYASVPNSLGVNERTSFILRDRENMVQITGKVEPRIGADGSPADRGLEVLERFWAQYDETYFDTVIERRKDLVPLPGMEGEGGSGVGERYDAPKSLSHDDRESFRAENAKKFEKVKEAKIPGMAEPKADAETDEEGLTMATRKAKGMERIGKVEEIKPAEDEVKETQAEPTPEEKPVVKIRDLGAEMKSRKFDFLGGTSTKSEGGAEGAEKDEDDEDEEGEEEEGGETGGKIKLGEKDTGVTFVEAGKGVEEEKGREESREETTFIPVEEGTEKVKESEEAKAGSAGGADTIVEKPKASGPEASEPIGTAAGEVKSATQVAENERGKKAVAVEKVETEKAPEGVEKTGELDAAVKKPEVAQKPAGKVAKPSNLAKKLKKPKA